MTHSTLFSGLQGRLKEDAPLGARTWFRTGGNADWLFVPKNVDDLRSFLHQRPSTMPLTVLGACSNIIIRDGGLEGAVIRLAGGFADITRDGDHGLIVGAAALDVTVAEQAALYGLAQMEFLVGIPGSIGGAIAMNAGAYGGEMRNILDWVDILTLDGQEKRLPAADLNMSYRHSSLPQGAIVIRARLRGTPDDPSLIKERLAHIRASREESQPLRTRTGGSTFRNPEEHKAWALIDQAGCRGLRFGDAQISEKHCNFMLNTGQASSYELEHLGEIVKQRVLDNSGVMLQWEIKRLGRFLPNQHIAFSNTNMGA
ncbi:UDP-N-acetylmuramate dehydrogenase [Saccharibacter sp. 17.LH.SD]|uniref:UDP-N-acetylmuramate dehydrogenase n=1 Tax=Saccharibacter sp. 17.LH.SD TaxID=2689393 RepID=UPI001368A6D9|nr:UDP-N-acetylmuramate dehydrogenase [Saccharibacter sp. 17.LH.SD]MXV44673.1 UDP-N-acetylmuramate dehydrogenase [Saccharibacter sp. 17.LH.SD]